jgi:hypothetical protein
VVFFLRLTLIALIVLGLSGAVTAIAGSASPLLSEDAGTLRAADYGTEYRAPATSTFYVQWTYYAAYRNGTVKRIDSGSAGPYYTRREAQSSCDWYNSQDNRVGNVRYYYSARVVSR